MEVKAVRRLGWLVMLLLFAATPVVSLAAPDDRLIVPGVRIGKWTLSITIDDLLRMNGPGSRQTHMTTDASDADAVSDFTVVSWGSIGAVTYDQKRVVALRVGYGSLGYRTTLGIGFQATRDHVLKVYGKPTAETTPLLGSTRLIYDKIGIAFVINASTAAGVMWDITVFKPGTADRLWHLM